MAEAWTKGSLIAACLLIVTGCGSSTTINGAGATFPYPIYAKWAGSYHRLNGKQINYQSIGSGGGIAQIKQGTIDFGASDAPLTAEELDKAGLVQFPMVVGGVVPVVNVEGIDNGELKLTPATLAGIYLGEITKWNDPALVELNPDAALPDRDITVVYRSDGSGTTWIFTSYLAAVSPQWKEKVGVEKSVKWPVGVGGKGNEGVAVNVEQREGSIGYVELAFALQNDMVATQLQNSAGKFVSPTIESFASAAAGADWANAKGYYVVLVNQPGEGTWPISGASFILLRKEQTDAAKAAAMLEFFRWCYRHGADGACELHYVPIPESVYTLVEKMWRDELRAAGRPVAL